MPNYRRLYVQGGQYFFTVVTYRRRCFLIDSLARECLRTALKKVQEAHPFDILALVLLPDHLHSIWQLPAGDDQFSLRWRRIKEEFTTSFLANGRRELQISPPRTKRGERGIWQRRFWEHFIKDEQDLERHMDYLHYNPVKHGYVDRPFRWPYSSFHRWVKKGIYPKNWGCGPMEFNELDELAME